MEIIAINSIFRDSIRRRNRNELQLYFEQISRLDYPFENLRFSFVESDSKDKTYQLLKQWCNGPYSQNCILEKKDFKVPFYGSVINPERFKVNSAVANLAIENSKKSWGKEVDWYLWLESDLIFERDLIKRLLDSAKEIGTRFVSPMIYIQNDGRFYDIYGFIDFEKRINFRNDEPYHPDFNPKRPMRMWCTGSTMLIHKDVVKKAHPLWNYENSRGILDVGENVNNAGFEIWLDPNIVIYHPPVT